ncbi:MAG: tRNA (adenosine(37)-N6)-threonylcarbamoyltransferase complex transferase subunit TsaD [Pseudomonadota bacterium]
MTLILGIETSCDETAAAIVSGSAGDVPNAEILSNAVYSQIEDHAAYGGVVPEIAARAHVEKMDAIIARALDESGADLSEVDAIAVTSGPGLGGGLIVGTMTAQAIGIALDKPVIGINHLEGHALTARLTDQIAFPYLLLLVSGGHTQIISVERLGQYRRLATTIDDALGEAFDKTAKLLGLGYPGGPHVEKQARSGDPTRLAFPRPMKGNARPDFSFSGLKTAVRLAAEEMAPLSERDVSDICASFQAAVTDTLLDRVSKAMTSFSASHSIALPTLVVAGGVAANQVICRALGNHCAQTEYRFFTAPMALAGDNAAMIAWAGLERFEAGMIDDPILIKTRWPLDPNSEPLIGSGKRGAKA